MTRIGRMSADFPFLLRLYALNCMIRFAPSNPRHPRAIAADFANHQ